MTKIFISRAQEASEAENSITQTLKEKYKVLPSDMQLGSDWRSSIKDTIKNADIVVSLISKSFLMSKYGGEELQYILSYTENSKQKLFIPILIGDVGVPSDMSQRVYISLDPEDPTSVKETIKRIDYAIAAHQGKVIANEEMAYQQKEKIETEASEYVEDAIGELQEREGTLRKSANFWYWMGYGAIAFGVIATVLFLIFGYFQFNGPVPKWDLVTFTAIKSIILVGLLLGIAKYSFSLAKSFMEESLKNADRIHAISFGKFFLQAFGEDAHASDIKEVFQHWNISGKNSFSNLNINSIEPKVFEMAFEFAKAMKSDDQKSPTK
ncbi:toll/interleukin-1 receptor domain-containing protein [Microbulbifer variabilis]|uniref:toll/interleukin-1 receptor domain-containing protein n=1 Tax=Microbulbifer variabilis TaxID=266805 RepID=UPI00036C68F7|nr:toll/interleukin-1 receptor domain-containing protein [Microbulbifer variabilis]